MLTVEQVTNINRDLISDDSYYNNLDDVYIFRNIDNEIIGEAELVEKDDVVIIRNIIARERGCGYGKLMLQQIFKIFNNKTLLGYSILEPSMFWISNGAHFEYLPDEDSYDGEQFTLKYEDFTKTC